MASGEIHPRDARAIRTLPRYLEEAWNRGDGLSYAALFTDDCDFVALDGTRLAGRAANAAHHQKLFDTVYRGSALRVGPVTVRVVTPDLALMHAEGAVFMPWHSAGAQGRRSLETYVVVRTDDGWRIAALQSAKVRPMSAWRSLARHGLRVFVKLRTLLSTARGLEPAGGW